MNKIEKMRQKFLHSVEICISHLPEEKRLKNLAEAGRFFDTDLQVMYKSLSLNGPREGRFYHTFESHIYDMLEILSDYENSYGRFDAIRRALLILAIFFHDIIYIPGSKTNEDSSGFCAYNALIDWGFKRENAGKVYDLIATTQHLPNAILSIDEQILCDIDLESLSVSPEKFRENSQNIRKEFSCFDDLSFYTGRLAWAKEMISRERIYHTPYFCIPIYLDYDKQARKNLQMLIDETELKLATITKSGGVHAVG